MDLAIALRALGVQGRQPGCSRVAGGPRLPSSGNSLVGLAQGLYNSSSESEAHLTLSKEPSRMLPTLSGIATRTSLYYDAHCDRFITFLSEFPAQLYSL